MDFPAAFLPVTNVRFFNESSISLKHLKLCRVRKRIIMVMRLNITFDIKNIIGKSGKGIVMKKIR